MNLSEATDLHAVLQAAYVNATPAALQQAQPAAVRLAARTAHAMSASGRRHVRPATLEQARPDATTAGGLPAAAVSAALARVSGEAASEVWRLAAENSDVGCAARREILAAALTAALAVGQATPAPAALQHTVEPQTSRPR